MTMGTDRTPEDPGTGGPPHGTLAHAQRELSDLMTGLEQTMDLVNRLSDAGEGEAAVRLIDLQRDELYRVMDTISLDAGRTRSFTGRMGRSLLPVAAAAVLVISGLMVSFLAPNGPDPVQEVSAQIDHAATLTDVRERMVVLVRVYERTLTLPAEQTIIVEESLRDALQGALDDTPDGDDNDPLVTQAERAVEDLEGGQPPEPPPAPGNEQGPLESIEDLIPDP